MEPRRRDTRTDRLSPKDSADGRSTGRALVIEPMLRRVEARAKSGAGSADRTSTAKLDEAVGLARAIDLDVAHSGIIMLGTLRPATYLGKGKVEEIAALVKDDEIALVVMDCALSPEIGRASCRERV